MVDLNLTETLIAIVIGAAICLFCGWKGAQAPNPRRGVRMTPYRFLMLLSASFTLFLVVHLLNLMGVSTGRP